MTLQRHPTVCLARFQTTDAAVPAPKECTDKHFKLTLVPYEELCDWAPPFPLAALRTEPLGAYMYLVT